MKHFTADLQGKLCNKPLLCTPFRQKKRQPTKNVLVIQILIFLPGGVESVTVQKNRAIRYVHHSNGRKNRAYCVTPCKL